jgi:hypothetical protein
MSLHEKPSESTPFERLKTLFFGPGTEQCQYEDGAHKLLEDGAVMVKYFNERRGMRRGQGIWCSFSKEGRRVFDFTVDEGGLSEVALGGLLLAFGDSAKVRVGRLPFAYRHASDSEEGVNTIESGRYYDPANGGKLHDEFKGWGEKIVAWTEGVIKNGEIGEIPLKLTSI